MFTTKTVVVSHLQPVAITIELSAYKGIPGFNYVGLPAELGREITTRLLSACKHLSLRLPHLRYVISCTPALGKTAVGDLDLAVLVGLLGLLSKLPQQLVTSNSWWFGRVSLDGTLAISNQLAAMLVLVATQPQQVAWIPEKAWQDVAYFQQVALRPLQLISQLWQVAPPTQLTKPQPTTFSNQVVARLTQALVDQSKLDLVSFFARPLLARLLSIAAAGWHHVFVVGPPGIGKTSAAEVVYGLLPSLHDSEWQEIAAQLSLTTTSGSINKSRPIIHLKPNLSSTQLLGSIQQSKLGALVQAHRGIVQLDDLQFCQVSWLGQLHESLQSGLVRLHELTFQAQYLFIGTANPCRCGFMGSLTKMCHCSQNSLMLLANKLSGAWLDRIDIHGRFDSTSSPVPVGADLVAQFHTLQNQIQAAWQLQFNRWGNGQLNGMQQQAAQIYKVALSSPAREFLDKAAVTLGLSERRVNKITLVARTIADLESVGQLNNPGDLQEQPIQVAHIAEALHYRSTTFSR